MAETPAIPNRDPDPYKLAGPVSQRVNIRYVMLVESHAKREPIAEGRPRALRPRIASPVVEFGRREDSNILMIKTAFSLTLPQPPRPSVGDGEKGDEEPLVTIEATFLLSYSADTLDDLTDENFQAFAVTNGVFNAWPYWREYVQSTAARMNLPPLVIPVYRLAPA